MDAELWAAYREDRSIENRNRLVEHYLPMCATMVKRFQKSIPAQVKHAGDLEQVAAISLIRAVESFQDGKRTTFNTHATLRIAWGLQDYWRAQDWAPRLARKRNEHVPLMVSANTVTACSSRSIEIGDELRDRTDFMQEIVTRDQAQNAIHQAWNETARRALQLYYLESKTMLQIGRELGLSESRVSQILKTTLAQLRDQLNPMSA